MKKQLNVRLSDLTHDQIRRLAGELNMNQAEVLTLAVDRMYREIDKNILEQGVKDAQSETS